MAATNCLNFGSPEKPEVMWQFSQAIDGIGEACIALGTPITGGNVSFYNETLGKSIYPTPVIGILGILDDAEKVTKIGFRNEGDAILLLDGSAASGDRRVASGESNTGDRSIMAREFSSSEYAKTIGGIVAGEPPAIDLQAEMRLIELLVGLAATGAVESTHDLSDGGLAVTLAESCFSAKGLGADVNIEGEGNPELALFGERGARAIVSVPAGKVGAVLATARQYKVGAREIGRVTRDNALRIQYKDSVVVGAPVLALKDTWANSLQRNLGIQ